MLDVSRELGSSVALYSRKVLIQTKATDILPKWLRFVRGMVAQYLCCEAWAGPVPVSGPLFTLAFGKEVLVY